MHTLAVFICLFVCCFVSEPAQKKITFGFVIFTES